MEKKIITYGIESEILIEERKDICDINEYELLLILMENTSNMNGIQN